jgi:hypothetical protein
MIKEHGAVGGMRIGKKDRSTRRKPAISSLCPQKIPHDPIWDETRATTMVILSYVTACYSSINIFEGAGTKVW